METPREFDVDAWHSAQSESAPILHPKGCCSWSDRFDIRENRPIIEQSISSALVWLTVGVMGLNILCLIIFYVDKCA